MTHFHLLGDKLLFPVKAFHIHHRFRTNHHDSDLALLELTRPLPFSPTLTHLCLPSKDFCENILMHSGKTGIAKRWGEGRTEDLVYITLDECRSQLNISHPLNNKMFCMRQRRHSGTLGEVQEQLGGSGLNQNQTHNSTGTPTGAKTGNSSQAPDQQPSADGRLGSEVSSGRCGGLLPGTPVATLDRGTTFLTDRKSVV